MNLLGDIRLALRTLAKNPGFTAVAITMLAVGIGVNATVFTVTNAVLFKGFALVQGNDRLRYITYKNSNCCVSYPDFLDWRAQSKSFEGLALVHGVGIALADSSGFPENLSGNENSADVFKVVGSRPLLGRDFTAADEMPGAAPVAILNYDFWERRYGKDPAVLGRTVRMNGALTTYIGVMPQGFSFPQTVDVWVPLVQTPKVMNRENRDTWMVVARLAKGVSVETAQAEMDIIGKRLATEYPVTNRELFPEIQTFTQFFIGPNGALIYGCMWGAVGFVLLIACANLANLLLARAIGRSREISVRIALGAGRWRIIRQLLIESLMLSGLGGFLGWWIAKWGLRSYALAMASKSSWLVIDYSMDQQVLAYFIAISIGTGLLFGLAPALRLSKLDVNASLKDGGRGSTGGHGKHLSALLVTGEMALAVVLLAGSGVMIRSYLKIHTAEIGADTANVLGGSVNLPAEKYPSPEDKISFFDRLLIRLAALPGVESVATGDSYPASGSAKLSYQLAGDPPEDRRRKLSTVKISPAYFRVVKATMLSGREFNDADTFSAAPVAIVNQLFASTYWPGEDPLGKRLRFFDGDIAEPWRTVVGVASNIMQSDQTRQKFDPVVYLPYRQKPGGGAWIFVRTSIPPAGLTTAFREAVQAVDPGLPLYGPMAVSERMEKFWDSRFYGSLFLIFAAIALLLASIGLYTVIAHSVNLRTQEIAIRMAIGGTPRDILKLVLSQGMLPLSVGLVIGLTVSVAVNRLLRSMLVQISPADPITLVVASAVLALAGALGCLIPARRAMRVDPVVALRNE